MSEDDHQEKIWAEVLPALFAVSRTGLSTDAGPVGVA